MKNKSKLTEILRDAVSDYTSKSEEKTPAEWLQGYLGEKLPEKSIDAIKSISGEILGTLDLIEAKKASMEAAMVNGQSAETWFANEVVEDSSSNGEKARDLAVLFNGISKANAEYENVIDIEETSVEEIDTQDTEEWNDNNWNNVKLKDTAKETVGEIVKTGFREIAADVYMKASEEGIGAVISDKEFIIDTVIDVAGNGVKAAVSAGLVIAEESGIIPPTTFGALATIAHKAVEEAKVFKEVIKGKTTIIQALSKIKNTVVSTAAAVWEQNKKIIKEEVVESVGYIFGVKGAAIAGAVNGLFTKTEDEPKLKTVLKSVANSVKGFMTKKIHLPFFNKNKNKQLEMN